MRRRWVGPVIEIVISFTAAMLLAWTCTNIKVDPLQRIGQISGLASIQIRFMFCAAPLLVLLAAAARYRGGAHFALASRIACAALAGLASGFVAGGIIVALRGTPFCLNAGAGDSEIMVMWANAISRGYAGESPPPFYPPLFPHLLAYYKDAFDLPAAHALKDLQIVSTLVTGPLAYLAWRLVLRPGWALAIGVIAALVVTDPYKAYGPIVLVVFVPIAIRYLARLRDAAGRAPYELVRTGVLYGVAFGVLCLTYSGWFRWAAPGLIAAALVVFPWRSGWKQGLLLGGVTLLLFVVVDFKYLTGMLRFADEVKAAAGADAPMIADEYFYFDVAVDPAYFTMWKGDLPGTTAPTEWPPPGELGGLGLYSLVLFAALGVAIALGRTRIEMITLACVLASTWFLRFWQAHYMFKTKLVQLWPRTTLALAYLFVVIAGFAIYFLYERFAKRAEDTSPLRSPNGHIGGFVALALLFGAMGSSIADRYMPLNTLPRAPGWLAFVAHEANRAQK